MPETGTELVLQTERPGVNRIVAFTDAAADVIRRAGGQVMEPPFDVGVGRCAVLLGPWGSRLVALDLGKGRLATDAQKNVTGTEL